MMKENTYIAIVEWADKKGGWIRAVIGWFLHWEWVFSSSGRDYLWAKPGIEPHDWSYRLWRSWEVPYPGRWKGKWITCAYELYLPPLWLLRSFWRCYTAWCRYTGHKKRGKDQVYVHGSCCDVDPTYTCRRCGDEW